MNAYDLKECPRCMSDDGYSRVTTEKTIRHARWDGKAVSENKDFKIGMAHCRCCGCIILDELKRLRKEK